MTYICSLIHVGDLQWESVDEKCAYFIREWTKLSDTTFIVDPSK